MPRLAIAITTEALARSIVWSSVPSGEGLVAMNLVRAQGLVQTVGPAS